MSAVARLFAFAVVLLAVTVCSTCAHAIGYVSKSGGGAMVWGPSHDPAVLQYGSCVEACQAQYHSGVSGNLSTSVTNHACQLSAVTTAQVGSWGVVPAQTGVCSFHVVTSIVGGPQQSSQDGTANYAGAQRPDSCPPGTTVENGACKCMPGVRPSADGKSCAPYTCTKNALQFANDGYGPVAQGDAMKGRLTCVGPGTAEYGCTLEYTAQSAKCADATHCYSQGSSATNGEYCDGTSTLPKTPPPDQSPMPPVPPPCPKNQCPGTGPGGVSMCVPCGVTDAPKTSTETSPDGTKGTKTETTCDGDQCTTTTTTTTTDGQGNEQTSTRTETEDQSAYCEKNPTATVCKESKWSGACGTGYQCDGDAIQCAIATEQHQRFCELATHTDVTQAGLAMMDNNPRPSGHPANSPDAKEVNFASAIDTSNPLGAGACPADQSFPLMGRTVVIPWSKTCDTLIAIGNIGVALSMMVAAFIAFKQS